MTEKKVIQYKCDFCNKKLTAKPSMVRHEKYCTNNPINHHACYDGCEHLCEDAGDDGVKQPFCNALSKVLYSITAERKRLLERFPESFEDAIKMPNNCHLYKAFI